MTWFADRSRYEAGFGCPFRRLLRYHLDGTGWTARGTEEQEMGQAIHFGLEQILNARRPLTRADLDGPPTLPNLLLNPGGSLDHNQWSEVWGLIHAWVRCNLGWLLENYEIVSAEEEFSIDVGDDIVWMARPDGVLRNRREGTLAVLDFKTTRAQPSRIAQIHAHSIQAIMNSFAVSSKYGEPVTEVQIHVLQVGTDKWPTPITHAYYRPANPPYVSEDWQPRSRKKDGTWLGKLYRKVEVSKHRPILDWVWEMPADVLADTVPLSQTFLDAPTQGLKVMHALASIRRNESWWRETVGKLDWAAVSFGALASFVPRTFACVEYARACEYEPICFDTGMHTQPSTIFQSKPCGLVRRSPHHPQEVS